ncbi:hypothetical protein MKW92_010283 [Papaver armeniacum]|nr:hypothetical protein MKW92_010283 [Papaver armeniacum]
MLFNCRPSFVDRWLWKRPAADARYISDLEINLVDCDWWREEVPTAKHVILHLDVAGKDVTWESMYPEWIDEEEESEVRICPSPPRPKNYKNSDIDHIAVKLPCRKSAHNWSRDVVHRPVPVLSVTDCFPLPNIFNCKELVIREGNAWVIQSQFRYVEQKASARRDTQEPHHREAHTTILHPAHVYVCGAIAAAQSIRGVGSTREFVILVDDTISKYHRSGLADAGWEIRTIKRIRNPKAEENAYILQWRRSGLFEQNLYMVAPNPKHMNFLKQFGEGDAEEKKLMITTLFGPDPPVLYVLHYLGLNLASFQDYGCNWKVDILQEFASDVAHKTWWKVHDAMPENLQKAGFRVDLKEAKKGNYTDRHWNITVTDERLKTCFKDFCFWGSLLLH